VFSSTKQRITTWPNIPCKYAKKLKRHAKRSGEDQTMGVVLQTIDKQRVSIRRTKKKKKKKGSRERKGRAQQLFQTLQNPLVKRIQRMGNKATNRRESCGKNR